LRSEEEKKKTKKEGAATTSVKYEKRREQLLAGWMLGHLPLSHQLIFQTKWVGPI